MPLGWRCCQVSSAGPLDQPARLIYPHRHRCCCAAARPDSGTDEAPHSYPTGVAQVAVNGVLVVENGAFTGQTPGKVIRDFGD